MLLSDIFSNVWALMSLSAFVTSGQNPVDTSVVSKKHTYPGHTLYNLNDGNTIPSPAWGTGTGTARSQNAYEQVRQALDNGWLHIDTSLNYRNQNETGQAIKDSKISREKLYITSKYDALSPNKSPLEELNITLAQLQLDYLDLYLIHFPRAASESGGIKKVWKEMEQAVKNGLVRSIGISNYDTPELLKEVLDVAKIVPAVNQISFSVYNAIDVIPALAVGAQHNILFSAYGELRPITKSPNGPADVIGKQIAKRLSKEVGHEVTYAQVIFAWLRSTSVLAVTTTSNKERLHEQLVPFGEDFPLLTAAEAKYFELSGWNYSD